MLKNTTPTSKIKTSDINLPSQDAIAWVPDAQLKKMRTFSASKLWFRKPLKDMVKWTNFNNKIASSFASVTILCGIALWAMGTVDSSASTNVLRANVTDWSTYKFNLVQLNQDENVELVWWIDKREEIGKEFEAILEIQKNVQSFEWPFWTVKYILLKTKNWAVAFTQKMANQKSEEENVNKLNDYFKKEGTKFDNIETITTVTSLAPKDLYSAFEAVYIKQWLDTYWLKKIFSNHELKIDKVTGDSKILFNIDLETLTNKEVKIIDVMKNYYGKSLYINWYNIEWKKSIDIKNSVSISIEL